MSEPDCYGLQINSQYFGPVTTVYTDNKGGYLGNWEQFVYSNDPSGSGVIYIEYWLLDYESTYGTCPATDLPDGSSWFEFSGNCVVNTHMVSVPQSFLSQPLSSLSLEAYVDYMGSGDDVLMLCTTTGGCSNQVTMPDGVLDLYQNWHYAEFNVYGDADGSEAYFNNGTTISVSEALTDQSGAALSPTCSGTSGFPLFGVYSYDTAEANNLFLGSCTSSSSGISFTESLGVPPSWGGYVACAVAYCAPSSSTSGITQVAGEWTVPQVGSTSSSEEQSSTWVGVGGQEEGMAVSDLISAGTEQDVSRSGSASYYAWWDVQPFSQTSVFTVNPSDTIYVNIVYVGTSILGTQSWSFDIEDVTSGATSSFTYAYGLLADPSTFASADWIEEASGGTSNQLPPFSEVTMFNDGFTQGGSSETLTSSTPNLEQVVLPDSTFVTGCTDNQAASNPDCDLVNPSTIYDGTFFMTYLMSIMDCVTPSPGGGYGCYSLSQDTVGVEDTITVSLDIQSFDDFSPSQSGNLAIGAQIRGPGTTGSDTCSDSTHDNPTSQSPRLAVDGSGYYSRQFTVCSGLPDGDYEIALSVWYVPLSETIGSSGSLELMETGFSSPWLGNPTLDVLSPSITLVPAEGPSGSSTLISGTEFTAGVTLSTSISSGAQVSSCGATVTESGTFSCFVTITSSAPAVYTVTVTGSDGSFDSASESFTVTQTADFDLSAAPSSVDLELGGSSNVQITATSVGGYDDIVSLSASNLPNGVTYSFVPQSGTPTFSSTLELSATSSATQGTTDVTVTGLGSDGTQYTLSLPITLSSKRPTTVSISPSSATVLVGSLTIYTLTVTDTSGSPTTPTGTLTWSDGGAGGRFLYGDTCTLGQQSPGVGVCAIDYVASSNPASVTISATYPGDGSHAGSSGTASLTVVASLPSSLELSPAADVVGATVVASASGFIANHAISISLAGLSAASGCVANSQGAFSCTVTVPAVPGGPETMLATDGTDSVGALFTVDSNLILTPSSGAVGASTTALGTGFSESRGIAFTLEGITATSSPCTSTVSGTFSCAVTVPSVPDGPETMEATDAVESATSTYTITSGGPLSYPLTFSETGLPGDSSWSVTVRGGSHSSTSATVSLSEPNGTYYYLVETQTLGFAPRPPAGTISVDGAATLVNISFLSSTPGVQVDAIPLPYYTSYNLAYDPENGLIYVGAGYYNCSIYGIDPQTDAIVSHFAPSDCNAPWSFILYDPVSNDIFAASLVNAALDVLTTTGATVAHYSSFGAGIGGSGGPNEAMSSMAVDPINGDVFVIGGQYGSGPFDATENGVSVFSSTGAAIGQVFPPTSPSKEQVWAIAFDTATGMLDAFSAQSFMIVNPSGFSSGFTDANCQGGPPGSICADYQASKYNIWGRSAVYDPYDSTVYAAALSSDGFTQCSNIGAGGVLLGINPVGPSIASVTCEWGPGGYDINDFGIGYDQTIADSFDSSALTFFNITDNSQVGNLSVAGSQATAGMAYDPTTQGLYVVDWDVNEVFHFEPEEPVVASVTLTPDALSDLTLGSSSPITASATDQFGDNLSGAVFNWTVSSSSLGTLSSTSGPSVTFLTGGTSEKGSVCVGVSSDGYGPDTVCLPVQTVATLAASLTPGPPTTEVGESSLLTLSLSGGVAPVSWTLEENGSPMNITGVSGDLYSFAPPSAGVYTFYLNATDSVGSRSDVMATVVVRPALAVYLTSDAAVTEMGRTFMLSYSLEGGVPPIAWTLTRNGSTSNLSGTGGGSYTYSPDGPGTYVFYLNATDAVGSPAQAVVVVTVNPALVATLIASRIAVDVGESVTLAHGTTGGVVPITSTLQASCPGLVGSTFTPTTAGSCTIFLNATDSTGSTSQATVTVTVYAALGPGVLSATLGELAVGQTTTIATTGATGGLGPYDYKWSGLPPGCNDPGNVTSFSCTPAAPGTYVVTLTVADANGGTASTSVLLKVTPVTPPPPPTQYTVTFTTSPSTCGSITFNGTTYTNGESVQIAAGTYAVSAQACTGYELSSLSGTGSVSVSGAMATVSGAGGVTATFVPIPPPPPSTYTVTFTETGIPAKTLAKDGWTVSLNGSRQWSTSATITFSGIENGTYALLVTGPSGYPVSNSGNQNTITVKGATTDAVEFAKGKTYTLTFSEKGLAKGQSWCLSLDGAQSCTTKTSQAFGNLTASAVYGAYRYAVVSPLGGQKITAAIGKVSVAVDGTLSLSGNTRIAYTFAYDYAVVFTETGAPANSEWNVTIGRTTLWNYSGDPITFYLSNGTYSYKVGTVVGYTSSGSPKKVVVPTATAVSVTFSKKKSVPRAGLPEIQAVLGAPSALVPVERGAGVAVTAVEVAAVVAMLEAAIVLARKWRRPRDGDPK